jgi:hypothetical protein
MIWVQFPHCFVLVGAVTGGSVCQSCKNRQENPSKHTRRVGAVFVKALQLLACLSTHIKFQIFIFVPVEFHVQEGEVL